MKDVYIVEFEFNGVRNLDAVFDSKEKAEAYVEERGFKRDLCFSFDEDGFYQGCFVLEVRGIREYAYEAGYAWVSRREVQ